MLPRLAAHQHLAAADLQREAAAGVLRQQLSSPKLLWLVLGALITIAQGAVTQDQYDPRTTSEQLCLSLGFVISQLYSQATQQQSLHMWLSPPL